ncbi:MAG TPA: tRNA pseudouridine(55) synthase TruB [Candidatus Desulfofervidus auxilii]|uniref:tRNA pseudouridine synthase B n=1 Tax=Desulfofervidus auxilii TaxID=1621989 RepID=A0A7C0Y366_DESA2|nr:tRNA pseudouridine(55) synthase TruB [Candidatus Desulfofervidus auxilii]
MEISGVLIINKPKGITSFGVVKKIKQWLKVKKAGHGGTLDPLATGVLPIFINKATRIAEYFLSMEKVYLATMRLGIETDTQDIEGEVINVCESININLNDLEKVMKEFRGKIKQIPPAYAAIKVKGIPLYKYARKGIKIECSPREVEIYDIKIISFHPPEVEFEVTCSKGTYIRTLCADIGKKLGCGACLLRLHRLKTGPFSIEKAISLEILREAIKAKKWQKYLINMNEALAHLPSIIVDGIQEKKIKLGQSIFWPEKLTSSIFRGLNKEKKLIALLRPYPLEKGMRLHPIKVFEGGEKWH